MIQPAAIENTSRHLTSPFAKGGIEGGFRHAIREEETGADITASHLTSALLKPQAPHERSESGGRMEEGLSSAICTEIQVLELLVRQENRRIIQQPSADITASHLTFSLLKGKMEKGFVPRALFDH